MLLKINSLIHAWTRIPPFHIASAYALFLTNVERLMLKAGCCIPISVFSVIAACVYYLADLFCSDPVWAAVISRKIRWLRGRWLAAAWKQLRGLICTKHSDLNQVRPHRPGLCEGLAVVRYQKRGVYLPLWKDFAWRSYLYVPTYDLVFYLQTSLNLSECNSEARRNVRLISTGLE